MGGCATGQGGRSRAGEEEGEGEGAHLEVEEVDGAVKRHDGDLGALGQARLLDEAVLVGLLVGRRREQELAQVAAHLGDEAAPDARPAHVDREHVVERARLPRLRPGHVRVVLDPVVAVDDKIDRARPQLGAVVEVHAPLRHVEVRKVLGRDCEGGCARVRTTSFVLVKERRERERTHPRTTRRTGCTQTSARPRRRRTTG